MGKKIFFHHIVFPLSLYLPNPLYLLIVLGPHTHIPPLLPAVQMKKETQKNLKKKLGNQRYVHSRSPLNHTETKH